MSAHSSSYYAQKRKRLEMRAHPEKFTCECGRPGYIVKSGEIVCRRCHEWEQAIWREDGANRGYAERRQAA